MTYRDDREALRARVENLEQEIERTKEAADEVVLFPKKTPAQRRRQALVVGGVIVAAAGLGVGGWLVINSMADREIRAASGRLSGCLFGEPLAQGESARGRARRIQLANVSLPRSADGRWPQRCQQPAHQLYQRLHEHGRDEKGKQDAAYWAEEIASKIEHGASDDDVLAMLDPLWKQVQESGIAAAPSATEATAPAPASPLHLADLQSAAVTTTEMPATAVYTEMFPGVDRHAIIDDPSAATSQLCTLAARSDTLACKPLPGELGKMHGLRLIGTTDAGAAPLVFVGREGEGGIHRADSGERVASVRAYSAYSAADGYVAIQTWPSVDDGSFEVIEQRRPGAEVKRTTVRPEAQRAIQPTTTIHRSRLLWDKAVIQMVDQRKLDTSPWVAFKTLGREDLGGAFHRVANLNWVNTTVMGCRGTRGMVARFGPSDAMLLFNEGDHWQGPLPARGLGDVLRCDGADAVFLSGWPTRVKRCTPAGCDDQTPENGEWPTEPARGTSTIALDFTEGKQIAAWVTERNGVRFRAASPAQIGKTSDVVVFDDLVGANGEPSKTSVLTGIRMLAAGHTAVLFIATNAGIRAIRLGVDGTFAPAKITH